jgi:NAD(P)-dependent dehydrogenase (short-subunit alcohol dehydrogenase family)
MAAILLSPLVQETGLGLSRVCRSSNQAVAECAPFAAPGAIETDVFGGAVRDTPEFNRVFADRTALGRVGLADDIGPMFASLLNEDNRWINAQRIEVSGGQGL